MDTDMALSCSLAQMSPYHWVVAQATQICMCILALGHLPWLRLLVWPWASSWWLVASGTTYVNPNPDCYRARDPDIALRWHPWAQIAPWSSGLNWDWKCHWFCPWRKKQTAFFQQPHRLPCSYLTTCIFLTPLVMEKNESLPFPSSHLEATLTQLDHVSLHNKSHIAQLPWDFVRRNKPFAFLCRWLTYILWCVCQERQFDMHKETLGLFLFQICQHTK